MELPFHVLLYRYYFFAWLFMDVNQCDLFARATAWHHNKGQARFATSSAIWSAAPCSSRPAG